MNTFEYVKNCWYPIGFSGNFGWRSAGTQDRQQGYRDVAFR